MSAAEDKPMTNKETTVVKYEYHRKVVRANYFPAEKVNWRWRTRGRAAHMRYELSCGHTIRVEGHKKKKIPQTMVCATCAEPFSDNYGMVFAALKLGSDLDAQLIRCMNLQFCGESRLRPSFVDWTVFSQFVVDGLDMPIDAWRKKWPEAAIRAYFHERNPDISRIVK